MAHRTALASTASIFALVGLVGIGGVGYRVISGSCPFHCAGCETAAATSKTVIRTTSTVAASPASHCGDCSAGACPNQADCPSQADCPKGTCPAAGTCPGMKGAEVATQAAGTANPAPVAPATGG